jgi:hypothetical protein
MKKIKRLKEAKVRKIKGFSYSEMYLQLQLLMKKIINI